MPLNRTQAELVDEAAPAGWLFGEAPATLPDRVLELRDRRVITFHEYGDERGFPILALHGTPGSRLKYTAAHAEAKRLGLRLICPDRWGYGRSDCHPAPRLAAYADDAGQMLDRLGVNEFSVVGISGGGPYAAAVAAALGWRVRALALVSPVGPVAEIQGGGMRLFHRLCFQLLGGTPGAMRLAFGFYRGMLQIAPDTAILLASARAGEVDKALMRQPDVRRRLSDTFRAGLERSVCGAVVDMKLFSRAWNVELRHISARTRIWIGSEDRNVPQGAVTALAHAIPGARLTTLAGQGHFWISRHYGEVLNWLTWRS